MITAVAAAEAINEQAGISTNIKWPNDILIKGKKIAGILTEISTEMDAIDYIVVGFGMNVNTPLADFPSEINQTATSFFAETNTIFSRVAILQTYLQKFEIYYDLFKRKGFAGIREKWKTHSDILGKKVIVKKIGDDISGQIIDIDHDGVLILKDKIGKVHRIFSGDLILQPPLNK